MKKLIYHGSIEILNKPVYGKGSKRNDYGLGFYCTENYHLAGEWAVLEDSDGYINKYELDMHSLKILNLNSKQYSALMWLTILLENRVFDVSDELAYYAKEYLLKNFKIPYRDYDVIIGYRADDSYFSYAQDFIGGAISYEKLKRAMKLGNLGEQIVLISEKAFSRLKFISADVALSREYFSSKAIRDLNARTEYRSSKKQPRVKGELYITQILDEEIKIDDPRL